MNEREAAETLDGVEVVPLVQGGLAYIKKLVDKCLSADIPAMAGCPPKVGKG